MSLILINLILKITVFGSNLSTDDVINLMFEAPRGKPKDDDRLTLPPRGVRDPLEIGCYSEQPPLSFYLSFSA